MGERLVVFLVLAVGGIALCPIAGCRIGRSPISCTTTCARTRTTAEVVMQLRGMPGATRRAVESVLPEVRGRVTHGPAGGYSVTYFAQGAVFRITYQGPEVSVNLDVDTVIRMSVEDLTGRVWEIGPQEEDSE